MPHIVSLAPFSCGPFCSSVMCAWALNSAVLPCRERARLGAMRAELSGEAMTFDEGPWAHGGRLLMGHLVHMPGHIFVR